MGYRFAYLSICQAKQERSTSLARFDSVPAVVAERTGPIGGVDTLSSYKSTEWDFDLGRFMKIDLEGTRATSRGYGFSAHLRHCQSETPNTNGSMREARVGECFTFDRDFAYQSRRALLDPDNALQTGPLCRARTM
jgi:hypothetical protein